MQKKTIRVGFDFDGVIAYNPFRIIRAPVTYAKRKFLRVKKLSFYYPQTDWQKTIWKILHESSIFPAKGADVLRRLTASQQIEAHLITARYSFLDQHLDAWLQRYNMKQCFSTINWNKADNQPHLFKEETIRKFHLDYFIEDNLDIVDYLSKRKLQTRIYWIYNIVDRNHPYSFKYPYLEKALDDITDSMHRRL